MKYSANKDTDKLIRQLVRDGWAFRWGSKHGQLLEPSGKRILIVSKTPGDSRSFKNFQRDVRRTVSGNTW